MSIDSQEVSPRKDGEKSDERARLIPKDKRRSESCGQEDGCGEKFFEGTAKALGFAITTGAMLMQGAGSWVEMEKQMKQRGASEESIDVVAPIVGVCSAAGKIALIFYLSKDNYGNLVLAFNRRDRGYITGETMRGAPPALGNSSSAESTNIEKLVEEWQRKMREAEKIRPSNFAVKNCGGGWYVARMVYGSVAATLFGFLNFVMADSFIDTVNEVYPLNNTGMNNTNTSIGWLGEGFHDLADFVSPDKNYRWTFFACSAVSNLLSMPLVVQFALRNAEDVMLEWRIMKTPYGRLRYMLGHIGGIAAFGATSVGFYNFYDLAKGPIAKNHIWDNEIADKIFAVWGFSAMEMLAFAITFSLGKRVTYSVLDTMANFFLVCCSRMSCRSAWMNTLYAASVALAMTVAVVGAAPNLFQADYVGEAEYMLWCAIAASTLTEVEMTRQMLADFGNFITCNVFKKCEVVDAGKPVIEEVEQGDEENASLVSGNTSDVVDHESADDVDDVEASRCSWAWIKSAPKTLASSISQTLCGSNKTRGGGASSSEASSTEEDIETSNVYLKPEAKGSSCSIM